MSVFLFWKIKNKQQKDRSTNNTVIARKYLNESKVIIKTYSI